MNKGKCSQHGKHGFGYLHLTGTCYDNEKFHFDTNEIDYTVRNSLLQLQKIKFKIRY